MRSHAEKYGLPHRAERERLRPLVEAGRAVCWRCEKPILPGEPWHLGHSDDGLRWEGPEHARCTTSDGGRKGYAAMIDRAVEAAKPRRANDPPTAAQARRTWSRHWGGPEYDERCAACRELGRACPDAVSDQGAAGRPAVAGAWRGVSLPLSVLRATSGRTGRRAA